MEVGRALGVPVRTLPAWLERSYGISGSNLVESERQLASERDEWHRGPGGMSAGRNRGCTVRFWCH